MRNSLLVIGSALALAGCQQLTGVKPPAVACHGYAAVMDTLVFMAQRGAAVDSVRTMQNLPAHICGMPYDPNAERPRVDTVFTASHP